jgi:hypothetical protein
MTFRPCLILAATLGLSSAAHAVECYQPPIFLLPVAVGVGGGEPQPMPFDWKADVQVTLKGTSCENGFTTVAGEEVTFGWTLPPEVAKTLTISVVGSRKFTVGNRKTMTLPAGKWTFMIEREPTKMGRLAEVSFTLRTRFKGEVMPE